ncbi:hypothetical protein SmJEL517_g00620 [Synchytrium microbalum]|uniref:Peroxisomal membrane protein PEX16 n=1 Tax=Synchytrium microbalum TaxID=1806994 RepID=A0A507CEF4_9FUNG|nr:uncharacterized protein SmJEL517_g00620 [Synchytrium microbalum]TPX37738.1 hypothetical protein SmJEL517_g00620 [Synchytrium microbalum]
MAGATRPSGYGAFVLQNATQIGSLESGFRTLTYVLPGRFPNSDLVAEAIGASVNIAALYHDTILVPVARRQPGSTQSPFNRYTSAVLKSSTAYQRVAYALTFMGFVDNLLEQGLTRRFGKEIKWPFVTTYEIIKLILRLSLFRMSRARMIPHSAVEEREYDPSKLNPESAEAANDAAAATASSPTGTGFVGSRSGKSFNSVETVGKDPQTVQTYLNNKALSDPVKKSTDLLQSLDTLRTVAELAFILRPIVYVLMIQRYGAKSWKPWTTSLAMEVGSLAIQTNPLQLGWRSDLTQLEKDEYQKRIIFLVYYILRGPFFSEYTVPRLQRFIDWGSQKMIVSIVTGVVKDMIPMWENVYYITAAY